MKKWKKIFFAVFLVTTLIIGVFLLRNLYLKNLLSYNQKVFSSQIKVLPEEKNFLEDQLKKKEDIEIIFLGDLMFDRYIREVAAKKGDDYIFENLKNFLAGFDLAVANLEGPITENNSKSIYTKIGEKGHLVFTFPKNLAPTLASHNINLVNIGNNHILNFGSKGLEETKKYLGENKIFYFGDIGGRNEYLIKNMENVKLAFINYNQFEKGSGERALESIRQAKTEADLIIIYTHWGTEYKPEPEESIKKLAREFVDAGGDLVIGTHPHVTQPWEDYMGKRIYYSLGNFIFDQYFSSESKKGLAIKVKINQENKKMEFEDIFLSLETSGQTKINR
ncbi:MAG TPA: CapA family protein [Candidatus Moranbacteria bacterium]|nr:CapA family protein [Candidatus Moranbacteria bacterium]